MSQTSNNLELLSAYICGDVSSAERANVEQLLARDAAAKSLEAELRALVPTLNAGKLPLKAALLSELRKRVEEQTAVRAAELSVDALLSASLSGDLDAREKQILEKHLSKYPHAQNELEDLRSFSATLKKGERAASAALSVKLAERLNAKLPPAAHVGQVGKARQPISAKASAPALPKTADRPSLRVYAHENPWRARAVWAASIAALIALAFGVSRFFGPPGNPIARNNQQPNNEKPDAIVKNDAQPEKNIATHRDESKLPPEAPKEITRSPEQKVPNVAPETPRENNAIVKRDPKIENSVPQPIAPEKPNVPAPNTQIVNNDTKPQLPPKAPNDPNGNNTAGPAKSVAESNPGKTAQPSDAPKTNGIAPVEGPTVAGQGPTKSNGYAQPNINQKIPSNETVAPIRNGIEVAMLKGGGNSQVITGGVTKSLVQKGTVPFGSEIVTDIGRVALVLPDGANLWINRDSRVVIDSTEIVLKSGEISYNGSAMTIVSENKNALSKASDADVKIENNAMTVFALSKPVTVSAKTKRDSLIAGEKAEISLNGNDALKKGKFNATPNTWTMDMQMTPTNEKEDNVQGKGRTVRKH